MSSHNSSHTVTEEEFENVCVTYSELRLANDELCCANDQLRRANQPIGCKIVNGLSNTLKLGDSGTSQLRLGKSGRRQRLCRTTINLFSHTVTEEEFENVCMAYSELLRANDELRRAIDQLCRANQPIGRKVNIKATNFEFRGKNSLENDPSSTSDFEALNADSDY
ncbi:hypothetical protein PIB30_045387 [Stylosanthes scabra]|uniref:Uncharacterized protein n=1 Tax=Stylosanthes scabra TaxID=79078 RepID=A0ABU6VF56_9FABA|nr:hypothetical protein [Stylosanthes scabra]